MHPCFFGDARRPLYGVYSPAAAAPAAPAPARRAGALLCYPGPQEYRQAHWAYRRLAALLADAGVPVLRFDYSGTGDSAGDTADARLAHWVEDVAAAAQELRDRAEVRRVSAVGLRLGGAVAARAAAGGLALDDLVLWDPVVSGGRYLAELHAEQAAGLRGRAYPMDDRVAPDELLGFALPPDHRAELAAIDLLAEGCGQPGRLLVVAGAPDPAFDALAAAARARGVPAEVRHVPDATLTRGGHSSTDTLAARRVPQAVAEYLAGAAGAPGAA